MNKIALITGAAKRVGAIIATHLHRQGYSVLIHYNRSTTEAQTLADTLNSVRPNSAHAFQADLNNMNEVEQLAQNSLKHWGRIDLLVNNASSFYPTPLNESTQAQWDGLINSNLRAPYFLSAALSNTLSLHRGSIINMIDIHAQRGLPGHPIYSIAKAGLEMMTKSLAKELGPEVRVNGVSPGAILWPDAGLSDAQQTAILDKTLLGRTGEAEDLAEAVYFLANADYITGQILAVDGGKSLYSH
ncbi:pteridine reductase [Neptuniibacter pectenicola]|jgi:pteridine reductase|uniref:pteridine reductase n=1 Tax=Neptuniibacter pectenicola TaxID=1806669 RepID=UPI000836BC25|nr:pteridine reductase [Neptuniibacter pectenicola]|tara:strand:+ start:2423 stop:3154 length:732 start_codon:yes stop_codon:yes gene_type:complete